MADVFLDDERLIEKSLFGLEIGNMVLLPIFCEIAFIPLEFMDRGEHLYMFEVYGLMSILIDRLLNPRLENQHAVVGFGDFAHDVGEAGVALRSADLKGVDQSWEANRADGNGAFACAGVTGVEAVELDKEALGGTAEVVADDVNAHGVVGLEAGFEIADGAAEAILWIADAGDGIGEDLPEGLLSEARGIR